MVRQHYCTHPMVFPTFLTRSPLTIQSFMSQAFFFLSEFFVLHDLQDAVSCSLQISEVCLHWHHPSHPPHSHVEGCSSGLGIQSHPCHPANRANVTSFYMQSYPYLQQNRLVQVVQYNNQSHPCHPATKGNRLLLEVTSLLVTKQT
jgi:hypothetical protein